MEHSQFKAPPPVGSDEGTAAASDGADAAEKEGKETETKEESAQSPTRRLDFDSEADDRSQKASGEEGEGSEREGKAEQAEAETGAAKMETEEETSSKAETPATEQQEPEKEGQGSAAETTPTPSRSVTSSRPSSTFTFERLPQRNLSDRHFLPFPRALMRDEELPAWLQEGQLRIGDAVMLNEKEYGIVVAEHGDEFFTVETTEAWTKTKPAVIDEEEGEEGEGAEGRVSTGRKGTQRACEPVTKKLHRKELRKVDRRKLEHMRIISELGIVDMGAFNAPLTAEDEDEEGEEAAEKGKKKVKKTAVGGRKRRQVSRLGMVNTATMSESQFNKLLYSSGSDGEGGVKKRKRGRPPKIRIDEEEKGSTDGEGATAPPVEVRRKARRRPPQEEQAIVEEEEEEGKIEDEVETEDEGREGEEDEEEEEEESEEEEEEDEDIASTAATSRNTTPFKSIPRGKSDISSKGLSAATPQVDKIIPTPKTSAVKAKKRRVMEDEEEGE